MDNEHSGTRLRAFLEERDIAFTEFASAMKVEPQNVNNWFKRGVPKGKVRIVCAYTGMNVDWLEDGVPPVLRSFVGSAAAEPPQDLSNAEIVGEVVEWSDETPLSPGEVCIPFLKEVELAAGSGRTAVEVSTDRRLRFGKYSLKKKNVQAEHAVAVTVRGNSMEPNLPDGATVAVNTAETTVTDGKTYAINHAGQLRVKLLYRLPGGGLRIRSYNRDEHPDEEYTVEQMREQEISVIGRVFWGAMFF